MSKRIFISDLHMSDERSYKPGDNRHPYAALDDGRIKLIGKFLQEQVLNKEDVKELIILGDLFDQWLCPAEFTPTACESIINAPMNAPIIEELKKIASKKDKDIYYVPGNHDMLVEKAEVERIFTGNFHFIAPPKDTQWPKFQSQEDGIIAEHGHLFSVFCSPDTWHHPPSILAPAYFLSRMVAKSKMETGKDINLIEKIMYGILAFLNGKIRDLSDVFTFLADVLLMSKATEIIMDGRQSFGKSITIKELPAIYQNLGPEWEKPEHTPTGLKTSDVINYGDIQELLEEFIGPYYFKPKIARLVICGHTHKSKLLKFGEGPKNECCYANTGTWLRDKTPSFIETERKGVKHRITRYNYTDKGTIIKQESYEIIM